MAPDFVSISMSDGIVLLNEEYPSFLDSTTSLSEWIKLASLNVCLASRSMMFGLPIEIALEGNKSVAASDSR